MAATVGNLAIRLRESSKAYYRKKITYYFYFFIIYYLPVFGLVYSLCIGFGELALALQSRYRGAELAHGMQIIRKIIYHADDVGRQISSRRPILRKIIDLENKIRESAKFIFYLYLFFGGNLSGDKKPKEPLGQRLLTSGNFGKKLKKNVTKKITTIKSRDANLLTLGNGIAAKLDSAIGIENGRFADHRFETSHSSVRL